MDASNSSLSQIFPSPFDRLSLGVAAASLPVTVGHDLGTVYNFTFVEFRQWQLTILLLQGFESQYYPTCTVLEHLDVKKCLLYCNRIFGFFNYLI